MQRSLPHKVTKSFHRMINVGRKSHLQYFPETPLFLNVSLKSQAYHIIIPFEHNFFIRNCVYRGSPFIMSKFGRLIHGFDFYQKLRAWRPPLTYNEHLFLLLSNLKSEIVESSADLATLHPIRTHACLQRRCTLPADFFRIK